MITYQPAMLPSPDDDVEANVIVDGKLIWRTGEGYTMDWATEVADNLRDDNDELLQMDSLKSVAAALRKAKADGMREAAEWTDDWEGMGILKAELLEEADKLDPSTE